MTKLKRLIELSERATKGAWFFNDDCGVHVLKIPCVSPSVVAYPRWIEDGKYIQAANPETIRTLAELLSEAREHLKSGSVYMEWREKFDAWNEGKE